jgi:hypothetical protein
MIDAKDMLRNFGKYKDLVKTGALGSQLLVMSSVTAYLQTIADSEDDIKACSEGTADLFGSVSEQLAIGAYRRIFATLPDGWGSNILKHMPWLARFHSKVRNINRLRHSEEEIAEMKSLIDQGMTRLQIADKMGLHKGTVCRLTWGYNGDSKSIPKKHKPKEVPNGA